MKRIICIALALVTFFLASGFTVNIPEQKNVTLDIRKTSDYVPAAGDLTVRSLGRGNAVISIPSKWTGVEEKSGNIEGFQYKLNEIPEDYRTDPEQLYAFYFSFEKYLLDQTDSSLTRDIEKSIIQNILKNEKFGLLFPTKSVWSPGRPTYDSYVTGFTASNRKIYNLEFVFVKAPGGIMCFLYVFDTSEHRDEILYVLQNLVIKAK